MKTYFYLLVLCALFTATGCQKEIELIENGPASFESLNKASDMRLRMFWAHYICDGAPFVDCVVVPIGCLFPGGNCLPTVEITRREENDDLDDFLDHIDDNTYDDFFSGERYKRTFGIVDSFPVLHEYLKAGEVSFVVQRSDTLENHLYLIGFDSSVDPSLRTNSDVLVTFEIDD